MTIAVVTGAARGIGLDIAKRLTADGRRVVLIDLNPAVTQVAQELGGIGVVADVTDPAGRAIVAEAIEQTGEAFDLLVNNAGITRDAMVHKMTREQFDLVIKVNLGAVHQLIEALAPKLADGGSIVNLSSRAQLGNVGQFNYSVSKTGVIGLTRAYALALAPRLRVNAVAPGFIASDMTMAMPQDVRERVIASIPLQKSGQPADIAAAVAHLAGPDAGYVTGQVVYVDGGRSFS